MTEEITGTVLSKIYESADGYTVAEIEADEPTVVVGNMPDLKPGELTRFFGVFKTHPKYGMQFAVQSYESTLPQDLNDMALFLGGGFIKGLGEVLARRIVEEFEDDTFDVIENDHRALSRVKGVSKRLADSIHAAFREYSLKKYVYSELMGMGLTARQATLAAQALGDDAAKQVRENPYLLIDAVRGIDFMTADKIAANLGIDAASPFRMKNGILNVMKKMLARGSTYVFRRQLVPHVAERLRVSQGEVNKALLLLAQDGDVVLRRYYPDMQVVFLESAYRAETACAAKLFALSRTQSLLQVINKDALISKKMHEYSLTEEQAQAVRMAADNRVCVVTGGPGTGKTTILRAVLEVLCGSGAVCALTAPTGRAAKRMQETTGMEAKTIHRLLEYSYDEDAYNCYFRRNADNPLDADVVIVDEVSMLDVFLFRNLLAALREGTRLILVGDADQLPSVGPGNVMRDVIDSGVVPSIRLTHRFRNAGGIADAAYDVLSGAVPGEYDESFEFCMAASPQQAKQMICARYLEYWKKGADVQVIAPIKKGELGTIELNAALREAVNANKDGKKTEAAFGDKVFRESDRVMQLKNNYAREWRDDAGLELGEGVFNGDIGVVETVHAGVVGVLFEDGKRCEYELPDLTELDAAYAYTIHKSQGSEFDVVIMPMMYAVHPFFARNLLYTGMTRAKKKVVVIGDMRTFSYMVSNGQQSRRNTILKRELQYLDRITDHEKQMA
ncbi:MAG: ATP-dependent RecD-like DNA helicase [Christensenella sp.]|nr:ATP-dependent RecD-like DNA helicase [Christensenella sp.]